MKLLEYEGKALIARHGVPVGAGALWPQVPESASGWVVKAQVLAGGRGKRGGILAAASRDQVQSHAEKLRGARLGDEPVHAVYIEPKLDIAHEYYLAALVSRDRGGRRGHREGARGAGIFGRHRSADRAGGLPGAVAEALRWLAGRLRAGRTRGDGNAGGRGCRAGRGQSAGA